MKVGTDGILLGAWAETQEAKNILDVGTGSGVIAIMMAQRCPQASITGVEVDQASFEQAAANMAHAPWARRLRAVHQSIQDYAATTAERYDLIISNPPFFTGGTFSNNQDRNSVRHTVKLPHGDLLRAVQRVLSPKGRFSVILPLIEGLRFEEMARQYQLYVTRVQEVLPKASKQVERLLLQFERQEGTRIEEPPLMIREEEDDFTEKYRELTRDFYLHF